MVQALRELPGNLVLKQGSHSRAEDGFCIMEAVAFVAGEPHSDNPSCACPVIATFLRSWNDALESDADRTRLLAPLIPKIVGTKATADVELARVMLIVDWFCREQLPTWLDLTPSLKVHADTLRSAKPIQDWKDFDGITSTIFKAQTDADAARAAARAAAGAAAWAAAGAAAWDAARAAARAAAGAAAWDAAWDAARAAAGAAAGAAAWDALRPTKEKLQISAVSLIERMIAVK